MSTTCAQSAPVGSGLVGLLLSRAPAVERLPVEVLTPAEVALVVLGGRVDGRAGAA